MRRPCPTFVGRLEELERLGVILEHPESGVPAVVAVAGEAGVGKTRLIDELVASPRFADARVLVGRCMPLAGEALPYGPITQALRRLGEELEAEALDLAAPAPIEFIHGFPQLSQGYWGGNAKPADNAPPQADVFLFILSLFGKMGQDRPILLVVEDVHWADRWTLDILTFWARNPHQNHPTVLVTYRDDALHRTHPLRPWLAELQRSVGVEMLKLRRLDWHETIEQLTALLGSAPEPKCAERIFARSEGNPFFTEELASAMRESSGQALPTALSDIVLAKIHGLSALSQSLLKVAAVAGRRASHELLRQVVEIPDGKLTVALKEAVDHQLLVPDLDDVFYTFQHALIQEVAYRDLLPGERRQLHKAFARALTDRSELATSDRAAALVELADHWYAAHEPRHALSTAVQAGQAAGDSRRFADALRQFERARELWEHVPQADRPDLDRLELLERAAEYADLLGEYDQAIVLVRHALELVDTVADPVRAGLLYVRSGWYHLKRGDDVATSDAYHRALRLIPSEPPSAARASALALAGRHAVLQARSPGAQALCEQAIELARMSKARAEEGRALNGLGLAVAYKGDLELGIKYLFQALSLAGEVGDSGYRASGYLDLSAVLARAGRLEDAVEVTLEGRRVTHCLGLDRQYGMMLKACAAGALFELGRWEEAAQLVTADGRRDATRLGEMAILSESTKLATARGDFTRARQELDRATTLCRDDHGAQGARELLELRVELAIWQGRLDDATRAVAEGLQLITQGGEPAFAGRMLMLGLRAHADRAELARARGAETDIAAARDAGHALLRQASGLIAHALNPAACPLPEHAAAAATCAAETARLDGRASSELWATAAAHWDALGRPYRSAYARWREADTRLTAGDTRHEAGSVLKQSHHVAMRLGAQPLRCELERLARRARIDLEAPHTQDQEATQDPGPVGTLGLTPREFEVLQHLAIGRSNYQISQALFISKKTASVHVSHILRKLGAGNRTEAAGIAYRILGTSLRLLNMPDKRNDVTVS